MMFLIYRPGSYGVTDAQITSAGFPPFDREGKRAYLTTEERSSEDKEHDSLPTNRLRAIILTAPSWKKFQDSVKAGKLAEKKQHAKLMEIKAENKRRLKLEREILKKTKVSQNALLDS